MGRMISTGMDVVGFLKEQHVEVKALFDRVAAARGDDRKAEFVALRQLLAVHETAEEEIVHPAARRALPNGDAVVDARLREMNEAKQVLSELEGLDADSPEFEGRFKTLRSSVVRHAAAEEREEFAQLAAKIEPERLNRMRTAVDLAERIAPTRPHAGIESATANLLAGPFVAMLDRARDMLSAK